MRNRPSSTAAAPLHRVLCVFRPLYVVDVVAATCSCSAWQAVYVGPDVNQVPSYRRTMSTCLRRSSSNSPIDHLRSALSRPSSRQPASHHCWRMPTLTQRMSNHTVLSQTYRYCQNCWNVSSRDNYSTTWCRRSCCQGDIVLTECLPSSSFDGDGSRESTGRHLVDSGQRTAVTLRYWHLFDLSAASD